MKFRKNPVEFEAVQFTGDNWEEMQAFCGTRTVDGHRAQVFNPIGHYLASSSEDDAAELWVEANESHLPIQIGEWVIKDKLGFYPCKDEIMQVNNTPVDPIQDAIDCTCETPTFEQDLVGLLNYHSMERYSGTPDWVLANYLVGVLRQFDCAVAMRADWRGESIELPALQELRSEQASVEASEGQVEAGLKEGLASKKVPLVTYTDEGKRNEIGTAVVEQWPGEMRVSGTITGVVPMFSLLDTYSIDEKHDQ